MFFTLRGYWEWSHSWNYRVRVRREHLGMARTLRWHRPIRFFNDRLRNGKFALRVERIQHFGNEKKFTNPKNIPYPNLNPLTQP